MFIAKNNDLIILASQNRKGLEQALQFMVYTDIEETDIDYKLYNGQYVTQEEIDKQEMERIGGLTMTSLDLIGYLRSTGLTLKEINDFLDENLELKTQLQYCQNCYCKVVASICPLVIGEIIIDNGQVIEWFKDKNHYIEPTVEVPDIPFVDNFEEDVEDTTIPDIEDVDNDTVEEENLDVNIIDHETEYFGGKDENTTDTTTDIPVQFATENTLEEGEITNGN